MKKLTQIFLVILLLFSCSTNPLTGRKSFSLVGEEQIIPQSFAQYQEVISKNKIDNTSENAKRIKRVGEKLRVAAEKFYTQMGLANDLAQYKWEYNLILSEELNAWCMPGGKIAFYSGIMNVCQSDAGIAVVMGHEIAHALAKHSAERISQQYAVSSVGNAIGVAGTGKIWGNVFGQLYPVASGLTILSYGRKQELDADKAGLFLMAMAGYDPREAPKFWVRMKLAAQTAGKQNPPLFLSTHPGNEDRIAQINANMPEALNYFTTATGKR
jgi:predicted Zn-dependent protease